MESCLVLGGWEIGQTWDCRRNPIRVEALLNLLEPPIPQHVIDFVPAGVAHTYRIVPVELSDDELTVAADKPLSAAYLDELRWYLDIKKFKAVTVPAEHLNLALEHYYPAALLALVRTTCLVFDPDVLQVRLTALEDRTAVSVLRRGAGDIGVESASDDLCQDAIDRVKARAGIAANTPLPQSGTITLRDADKPVTIVVEARLDGDRNA